jgi:hypothetical protein
MGKPHRGISDTGRCPDPGDRLSRSGGLAALLDGGGGRSTRSGGDFNHLVAQLALGDFLQRDIHERELRVERDKRTKALTKLADALGDNVDENLGALHGFKGILDERLFHNGFTDNDGTKFRQAEKF